MVDKSKFVRLNVDCPKELKSRAKRYCIEQEMTLKELVALALENTLDELEEKTA